MTSAEKNEKAAPDKSNPKSYDAEKTTRAAVKDNVTIPMKRRDTYTESACEEETFHQELSSISFGSLNFRSPIVDREAERWAAEQMGLNTCILGSKIVHLLILLTICVLSFCLDSPTLGWTFIALLLLDLIVLGLSIGHVIKSHLGVLLALIGVESLIAIAGIVMAITVMWADNGKNCELVHCRTLELSAKERFFFFWLLLGKGMLELFLSLMIVAMSPIIHDRNQDDWTTHHSNHYAHDHGGGEGGYKDWFLSPGGSSRQTDSKLNNGAFDEDSA